MGVFNFVILDKTGKHRGSNTDDLKIIQMPK